MHSICPRFIAKAKLTSASKLWFFIILNILLHIQEPSGPVNTYPVYFVRRRLYMREASADSVRTRVSLSTLILPWMGPSFSARIELAPTKRISKNDRTKVHL